jgi:hypothetical protein
MSPLAKTSRDSALMMLGAFWFADSYNRGPTGSTVNVRALHSKLAGNDNVTRSVQTLSLILNFPSS